MSELVFTTSSSQRDRKSDSRSAKPLVLSETTTVFLEPTGNGKGYVTLAGHSLFAHQLSDDLGQDGQIAFFAVEGARTIYEVTLYDDHVCVQTSAVNPYPYGDDEPPFYCMDEKGFMSIGSFARYVVNDLIPDCLAAQPDHQIDDGSP